MVSATMADEKNRSGFAKTRVGGDFQALAMKGVSFTGAMPGKLFRASWAGCSGSQKTHRSTEKQA
jgi:hypothetical protein